MTKDEVLKLAREELRGLNNDPYYSERFTEVIEMIDEALAQPEHSPDCALLKIPSKDCDCQDQQEPVASGEPLPCPFCGHTGLDFSDGSTYRWGHASCGGCGAKCGEVRREYPDKGEWHSEAITEWNRRYTHPQAREPLTDEELREALRQCPRDTVENLRVRWLYAKDFARAIEAAHGIKE